MLDNAFGTSNLCGFILKYKDSCDAIFLENDVGEDCLANLVGEDREGFGGICKFSMQPSNISTTLVIDGLSDGWV